jgi:hypothetical protein
MLPAELEARITALESGAEQGRDFDAVSWIWLALLGVAVPVVLFVLGWWW